MPAITPPIPNKWNTISQHNDSHQVHSALSYAPPSTGCSSHHAPSERKTAFYNKRQSSSVVIGASALGRGHGGIEVNAPYQQNKVVSHPHLPMFTKVPGSEYYPHHASHVFPGFKENDTEVTTPPCCRAASGNNQNHTDPFDENRTRSEYGKLGAGKRSLAAQFNALHSKEDVRVGRATVPGGSATGLVAMALGARTPRNAVAAKLIRQSNCHGKRVFCAAALPQSVYAKETYASKPSRFAYSNRNAPTLSQVFNNNNNNNNNNATTTSTDEVRGRATVAGRRNISYHPTLDGVMRPVKVTENVSKWPTYKFTTPFARYGSVAASAKTPRGLKRRVDGGQHCSITMNNDGMMSSNANVKPRGRRLFVTSSAAPYHTSADDNNAGPAVVAAPHSCKRIFAPQATNIFSV